MDPDTCLQEIMSLLFEEADDNGDRAPIVERLRNLADWIEKGGFYPKILMGENRFSDDEQTGHLVPFGY